MGGAFPPAVAAAGRSAEPGGCETRADGVSAPGRRWAASFVRGSLLKRSLGRTLGAGAGLEKPTGDLTRA